MQCHFLNRHLNLRSEWVGVDLRTDTKKNVLKSYQTTFSKFINCSRHIFDILGGTHVIILELQEFSRMDTKNM